MIITTMVVAYHTDMTYSSSCLGSGTRYRWRRRSWHVIMVGGGVVVLSLVILWHLLKPIHVPRHILSSLDSPGYATSRSLKARLLCLACNPTCTTETHENVLVLRLGHSLYIFKLYIVLQHCYSLVSSGPWVSNTCFQVGTRVGCFVQMLLGGA
jgi:hypothetical protein